MMADGMKIREGILTRMMRFTADLDTLLKNLPACLTKNKLQDQLGRSGSSVGANYAESRAAESTKDFIHKLSIALKEAEETDFWLGCLIMEYPQLSQAEVLRRENHEFVKILQSSISTARRRLHSENKYDDEETEKK